MALPSHDSWMSEGGHGPRRRRGMRSPHLRHVRLTGAAVPRGLLKNASCPRELPVGACREGPDWPGWTPGSSSAGGQHVGCGAEGLGGARRLGVRSLPGRRRHVHQPCSGGWR